MNMNVWVILCAALLALLAACAPSARAADAAATLTESQQMLKELGLLEDDEIAVNADGSAVVAGAGGDVDLATLGSHIAEIDSVENMVATTKKFGIVVVAFHNGDSVQWKRYRPVFNEVAGKFDSGTLTGGAGEAPAGTKTKEAYDVLFASVDMNAHRAVGRRFAAAGPIAVKLFNKYMPRRWLNFYPGSSLHPAALHRYVAARYDGFIKRLREGDGLARRFMRAVLRSRKDGEGGGDVAGNAAADAIVAQAAALHARVNATARTEQRAAHAAAVAQALRRAEAAEADPDNTGLGNATQFRAFAARPYVEVEAAASAKARIYHETMLELLERGTAAVAHLVNGRRQEYPSQRSEIDPAFERKTYAIAQQLNVLQAFLDSMFMSDEELLDDTADDEIDRAAARPEEKKRHYKRAVVKENTRYNARAGSGGGGGAMM